MSSRTRLLAASLALILGFLSVYLVREYMHTEQDWEEQMEGDFETALSVLTGIRSGRLPLDMAGEDAFWRRWDRRMDLYDSEHRAELGGHLALYLEFIQAEYADMSEIYRNGDGSKAASDAAVAARGSVSERLGEVGRKLITDADELREDAYNASPVHSGLDPDLVDYIMENEVVKTWAPEAQRLIARMVEEPDKRTGR